MVKQKEVTMVEDKEVKEKKVTKEVYGLDEVPTQTAIIIKNLQTGEEVTSPQALVQILNKLEKIERLLG